MQINSTGGSGSDYSRITGLATGMDTDAMVKAALAAEQQKINTVLQNKQTLEWQQEAYVDIIKDLKEFYNSYLDILGPSDTNMISSGTYAGVKASTESGGAMATANGGAMKGSYNIAVTTIATTAKVSGAAVNQLVSGSISLDSANWEDKTLNFQLANGEKVEIKIDPVDRKAPAVSGDAFTMEELQSIIQEKITSEPKLAGLSVTVDGSKLKFTSSSNSEIKFVKTNTTAPNLIGLDGKVINNVTKSSKLADLGITDGNFTISVNNTNFTIAVDSTKTVDEFMSTAKSVKLANGDTLEKYININFSELTKKMTIETKETGKSQILNITAGTSNAVEVFGIAAKNQEGTDAVLSITAPGEAAVNITRSSNKFTIDNISYDLSGSKNGEVSTISIKADATDQVAKFKKFVEKYNTLIAKVNDKISEKKNYNYKPLTEDQKKEMSEDEIKAWEKQAKKGLLARDSSLSNIILQLRQSFYSSVSGAGINITDIGISTTSNWRDGGKLEIDEKKLKDALENKGDLIQKLFTQNIAGDNGKGIIQKTKDTLNTYIGSEGILVKKAGYINTRWAGNNELTKNIEEKSKAIKEMEQKMYTKQERYYQMFAALERNMNNLNSQSSWLASQLGAL
jgi:flagellar hook-associated protein 2